MCCSVLKVDDAGIERACYGNERRTYKSAIMNIFSGSEARSRMNRCIVSPPNFEKPNTTYT